MHSAHRAYLDSLPAEWAIRPTQAIGEVVGGSTPSRAVERFWGGTVPWVTPGELTVLAGKYLETTREKITDAGLASCGAKLLPADTLLVTSRATLGAVALTKVPTATNQGFKSVVFTNGHDPHFYYHLFHRLSGELARRASGTTFLEIPAREFRAIEIPVPPLPEQRQIAEILDTLDEAICKTEAIIEKLKRVKQGLLHDLLTRGIDDNGELRDPDRHPEQFKDSPRGWIPNGWALGHLGKSCDLLRDGTHLPPPRVADGPRLLSVRNMENGKFVLREDDTRVPWSFFRQMHAHWSIEIGDVLLAIVGATLGKSARVGPLPPFTLQRSVSVLRGNARVLSNDFLYFYVTSVQFQNELWRLANQTAQPGVYLAQLASMRMPLPPLDEQNRIAGVFSAWETRIEAERRELGKFRRLKRGLMDELLTGRVRVTSLLEEAAE